MEIDYGNNIEETTALYEKVQRELEILTMLKNRLQRRLKTDNGQTLASTLCSGDTKSIKREIQTQIDMILERYDAQLVDDIVHEAMTEVFGCKTPSQMSSLLWSIYRADNLKSFELMVQFQLTFFHNALKRQQAADMEFQRVFGKNLYKFKQSPFYPSLSGNLKQKIDLAILQLLRNMQYLLFHEHFCLMNSKYSEYIYTAMGQRNLDSFSRYIWLWHDKRSIDITGHIKAMPHDWNRTDTSDLLVQLKGTEYDVIYYMRKEDKMIAGWEPQAIGPMNSIWNVELIDNDRVVFYQGNYIMCSTDEKHDGERRTVRAYERGTYTFESNECQWLLGTCNRK
ncbi:uncharacterized protein LOC133332791 [Musca vetustissima]|uniref:uncharacterized protein LOC133332791 n=1 Tax=Musca vetustissima TaxID=27455 RepID=UPI002AB63306|nr:uncharacterized protein LOC133332791 [Musca vetustissima]